MDIAINTFLAFIEGLGLITSPCILPILPIVLSTSLTGSRRRPFGITLGFVITFAVFTFFSRTLVESSGVNLDYVRYTSFGILIFLGLVMLSTSLSETFTALTQRLANIGSSFETANNPQGGFISGLLLGSIIALIWTPCAGPILAAVIVQTVLQKTTLGSFFVLLAFALGAGVPMLVIAWFGRAIMSNLQFLKKHSGAVRKLLGIIVIAAVGFMIFSEAYIRIPAAIPETHNADPSTGLINGISPYPAPDFGGIADWINSPPLTMQELKGKVVLIDFWTYSCINCIRTLPYIKEWYAKYHDKGLVIIGVHTPEFAFEKDISKVKAAVQKFGISYPVALDSNYGTWQNFSNQYWPAHYLIDKDGNVVYQHFGEGEYDTTENNIRYLLGMNALSETTASTENKTEILTRQTPETYLGYERSNVYVRPDNIVKDSTGSYTFPQQLDENSWALNGKWIVNSENIVSAGTGSALRIHFRAKHVFIVMGNNTNKPIPVDVSLNNGAVITYAGRDVIDSRIMVDAHALYDVLKFSESTDGVLEITAEAPGLEVYTFTFG